MALSGCSQPAWIGTLALPRGRGRSSRQRHEVKRGSASGQLFAERWCGVRRCQPVLAMVSSIGRVASPRMPITGEAGFALDSAKESRITTCSIKRYSRHIRIGYRRLKVTPHSPANQVEAGRVLQACSGFCPPMVDIRIRRKHRKTGI